MPLNRLKNALSGRPCPVKYLYYYLALLLVALAAFAAEIPWFGFSMLAGIGSLMACGAHPLKSIGDLRMKPGQSHHRIKVFLFNHHLLVFVIILPCVLKLIFY